MRFNVDVGKNRVRRRVALGAAEQIRKAVYKSYLFRRTAKKHNPLRFCGMKRNFAELGSHLHKCMVGINCRSEMPSASIVWQSTKRSSKVRVVYHHIHSPSPPTLTSIR